MFQRLRRMFRRPPPPPPQPDARLALGALLVRVAQSDHNYEVSEISLIDRILARLYHLKPIEAAKMRATCERVNAANPDIDALARHIRAELDPDARRAALVALWQVVMADGAQDDEEVRIVETARAALGLSAQDSASARAEAAAN